MGLHKNILIRGNYIPGVLFGPNGGLRLYFGQRDGLVGVNMNRYSPAVIFRKWDFGAEMISAVASWSLMVIFLLSTYNTYRIIFPLNKNSVQCSSLINAPHNTYVTMRFIKHAHVLILFCFVFNHVSVLNELKLAAMFICFVYDPHISGHFFISYKVRKKIKSLGAYWNMDKEVERRAAGWVDSMPTIRIGVSSGWRNKT